MFHDPFKTIQMTCTWKTLKSVVFIHGKSVITDYIKLGLLSVSIIMKHYWEYYQ